MGLRTILQRLLSTRKPVPASEAVPVSELRERRQHLEELGRNAGGILHDLNNLLTIITGYSELALRHPDNLETLHNSLHEIHQSAVYASALSRHYLRRPADSNAASAVSDVNQVLRNMRGTLQGLLGSGIQLTIDLTAAANPVHASAVQMVQIILNLTLNARDAMSNGGSLHISTSNAEFLTVRHRPGDADSYLVLSVNDTGMGMNAETRQRIFDPFFTTKNQSGTGLGLTTVRDVARSAGGFVRVESELGHGTCFRVYLPCTPQNESGSSLPDTSTAGGSHRDHAIRTPYVLVVEDQDEIKDLITETLQTEGYHVIDCNGSDQAIDLCRRTPTQIDLLVADLHVSGMDGDELADRLQALRPEMRVLLISGDTVRLSSLTRSANSTAAILAKPFSMHELRAIVQALIPFRSNTAGLSS